MREEELAEIEAELQEMERVLSRRLGAIQVHLRHEDGPLSADSQERATERENDEVLEHLDDAGRLELAQVRRALEALGAGTFGRCVACDGAIGERRLRALPYTSVCIACARAAEAAS